MSRSIAKSCASLSEARHYSGGPIPHIDRGHRGAAIVRGARSGANTGISTQEFGACCG